MNSLTRSEVVKVSQMKCTDIDENNILKAMNLTKDQISDWIKVIVFQNKSLTWVYWWMILLTGRIAKTVPWLGQKSYEPSCIKPIIFLMRRKDAASFACITHRYLAWGILGWITSLFHRHGFSVIGRSLSAAMVRTYNRRTPWELCNRFSLISLKLAIIGSKWPENFRFVLYFL